MNNLLSIEKTINKQAKAYYGSNPYGHRHATAWQSSPVALIIKGLAKYADDYAQDNPDCVLAHDYVLGDAWIEALKAVRVMLNGELKGLDGGFTDSIIIKLAEANGFNDNLEVKEGE